MSTRRDRLPYGVCGAVLGMLAWWGAAASAPAENQRSPATLLVVPFDVAAQERAYDGLRHGVPDMLAALLAPYQDAVQLVEREQWDHLLDEQGLSWQGYLADHSLSEVGHLVQARYLLRGSTLIIGHELQLHVLIYETETTRLVGALEAVTTTDQWAESCRELAAGITQALTDAEHHAPALPVENNPQASRLLIQGLGAYYTGRYPEALPAFIKIIAVHPDDPVARYWFARTLSAAGLPDQATIAYREFLERFPTHAKAREVQKWLATSADTREGTDAH